MARLGAETEIRGGGLVTVLYDNSLYDPNVKYKVIVNREKITDVLKSVGFTNNRLSTFTLRIDTADRTNPFESDDKGGIYDEQKDRVTVFTRPHRLHRKSPTATLLHEIYHSVDDNRRIGKLGRDIQRWSPAIMVAPIIAGFTGAYFLNDPDHPSPETILFALEGVLLGITAGIAASELPYTMSGGERRAWRFSKEKMKDPNLRDLIILDPRQYSFREWRMQKMRNISRSPE